MCSVPTSIRYVRCPPFQYICFLCGVPPPFATLGSVLDSKQSWESGKFQLVRWSHRLFFMWYLYLRVWHSQLSLFVYGYRRALRSPSEVAAVCWVTKTRMDCKEARNIMRLAAQSGESCMWRMIYIDTTQLIILGITIKEINVKETTAKIRSNFKGRFLGLTTTTTITTATKATLHLLLTRFWPNFIWKVSGIKQQQNRQHHHPHWQHHQQQQK